jgi:hypothetical protein
MRLRDNHLPEGAPADRISVGLIAVSDGVLVSAKAPSRPFFPVFY